VSVTEPSDVVNTGMAKQNDGCRLAQVSTFCKLFGWLIGWLHCNETLNSWLPSTKKVTHQGYVFISHVVTEIQSMLVTIVMCYYVCC